MKLSDSIKVPPTKRATTLSEIFSEEPVDLTTFVTDKRFLGNPPLSAVQYEFLRHMEQIYFLPTYELMRQEFGEYWKPVRQVNFLYVQWGKGCQLAGELVYDATTGQWVPVERWIPSEVASYSNGLIVNKATESWKSGTGPSLAITFSTGLTNRVFEAHRYLTPTGWKEAKNLSIGDRVASARQLPEPTNTIRLPSHEVELVGWWLGDGVMPTSEQKSSLRMMFANHEQRAYEAYKDAVVRAGDAPLPPKDKGNGCFTVGSLPPKQDLKEQMV